MKGFEIYYNGETTKVAVEDGVITIDIFNISGNKTDRRLYVGGVDYEKCEENIWFDWHQINTGDKFQIKVVNIDKISTPVKTKSNLAITRSLEKLEFFRRLEEQLIKDGVL